MNLCLLIAQDQSHALRCAITRAPQNGLVAMFVFDPERVVRVLDVLPALGALLRDPRAEGRPSAVFEGMRLTDRALYRLLANPHYPRLRESLRGINAAAASALKLKELRNANLRGDFGSYLQARPSRLTR
jgi:hypothetical protein